MPRASVTMTFPRGDDLAKALKALGPAVFRRVARAANAKAMRPVVQRAKALVVKESGLLRRSIGVKTKLYPKKLVVATVVGARSNVREEVVDPVTKQKRRKIPSKYAHLVEYGHRVARKGTTLLRAGETIRAGRRRARLEKRKLGKSIGFVPAKPFMRPAFDGQVPQMTATLRKEYAAAIEREHAKSIKKLEKLKGGG